MGVYLTPIIVKTILTLDDLRGQRLAVDANNYLYQFLALLRSSDGTPLHDQQGRVTSHLAGLLFRTTRLIHDYALHIVFVFDGAPPVLKQAELQKRRAQRQQAEQAWHAARARGDYASAFSKAVMTSRLTAPMIADAQQLLQLLGIPWIQAPSEAEAQCAFLAQTREVWAASSKDYDTLLFGAPRLLRFLTLTGQEYLPSQRRSRPLHPELIDLAECLATWQLTHRQLIDVALLIGTDFNPGIKGIGPKRALKAIRQYGALEQLPGDLQAKLDLHRCNAIRQFFLHPPVTADYVLEYHGLQEAALRHFLVDDRAFSMQRVSTAITRMKTVYTRRTQRKLLDWWPQTDISTDE
jgi:flap endonuclease-1